MQWHPCYRRPTPPHVSQTSLGRSPSQGRRAQIARVPASPDAPGPPEPPSRNDGPADDAPPARRLGDPVDERPVPRGCHPFVFGIVMATIQFAVTIYFMRTC